MNSSVRYIDLFAGAGGLSEGFIGAGYEPVAHVESDAAACYTLKTRLAFHYLRSQNQPEIYSSYLNGSITREQLYSYLPEDLLASVINKKIGEENDSVFGEIDRLLGNEKIDIIIGGPPCQAYSLVGRARSEDGMRSDPRNHFYVQYAKYLEKYKPKLFVFENVLGLKSAKKGAYLENMERLFLKKGYLMKLYTLTAGNFGVLQNRKRIIILGWQKEKNYILPDLESINIGAGFSVCNIFSDLPEISAGQDYDKGIEYKTGTNEYLSAMMIRNGKDILTQHITRPHTEQDKQIYRFAVNKWNEGRERLDYNDLPDDLKSHKNRHSFVDRFKVVARELSRSQTVVAHISKDGHYYIHPDINQNRSISVREAARLQSFPDSYYFEGVKEGHNRTAAFRQIGNAVPPLMAGKIATSLKYLLSKS
ncbi:MAG: DNA cytosine methyltransferase [Candidatus Bathyarchaeota archaeon]|nr:DNA cytosine methyltransferase [Candidatus Bathyarchaeota archaeon]